MAISFGLLSQNYCPGLPGKEHAGKDVVHPYRHV
jgi:hypothetical protein